MTVDGEEMTSTRKRANASGRRSRRKNASVVLGQAQAAGGAEHERQGACSRGGGWSLIGPRMYALAGLKPRDPQFGLVGVGGSSEF